MRERLSIQRFAERLGFHEQPVASELERQRELELAFRDLIEKFREPKKPPFIHIKPEQTLELAKGILLSTDGIILEPTGFRQLFEKPLTFKLTNRKTYNESANCTPLTPEKIAAGKKYGFIKGVEENAITATREKKFLGALDTSVVLLAEFYDKGILKSMTGSEIIERAVNASEAARGNKTPYPELFGNFKSYRKPVTKRE